MKNLFKIFIVNILLITGVLLVFEFIFFFLEEKNKYSHFFNDLKNKNNIPLSIINFIQNEDFAKEIKDFYFFSENNIKNYNFRPIEISENNKKGSIVIFGCSYAFGDGLEINETFSHLLSEQTGRNVYNFGIQGGCHSEALYLLKEQKEFLKERIKDIEDVEYVLYIQIEQHELRPFINTFYKRPSYTIKQNLNDIYLEKSFFNIKSYFLNFMIEKIYSINIVPQFKNYLMDLFYLHIIEINKEVKTFFNKNENTKFIFISFYGEEEMQHFMKKLNKNNITTIDFESLCNYPNLDSIKYYISKEDRHPNSAAWELITPRFIEKFNL